MSDYISREAAIEKIRVAAGCAECAGSSSALCVCNVCDVYNAIRLIKSLPTADVEPVRHGQWISLTDCSNAGVYCSICHKKVYKEDYAWCNRKNKVRSAYCPSCGSKMDLEE